MNPSSIDDVEVAYARFNAAKTFATNAPSRFEHVRDGELIATRDAARQDPYYNRILGLRQHSLPSLQAAIGWIEQGTTPGCALRVDVSDDSVLASGLRRSGFAHTDTIVWMSAGSHRQLATSPARELSAHDWPVMRPLLEEHGSIVDDVWQAKRHHLCTATFRWFGVFDQEVLVSAASIWLHDDVAVLGSAYTLPRHRGRGFQRSLIEVRRRAVGVPLLVDVEPGSTSHRNCLRAGFRDLEPRQVWTRSASQ